MLHFYTRSHPVADNEALVQYEGAVDHLPHLLVWAPVTTGRTGAPSFAEIDQLISPLMEHLDHDEREVVWQQINYVALIHKVTGIDVYDDSFIIHCNIDGVDRCMVVTIFALMDLTIID